MRTAVAICGICLGYSASAFVHPAISSFSLQERLGWSGARSAPAARLKTTAAATTTELATTRNGDAAAVIMAQGGGGPKPSVSRRSLLEGVASTFAATAALLATHPTAADAKPQRIKGGGPVVTLEDGAQYQEMTIGDGPSPKDGDRVAVHYSLFYKGLEVESSRDSQGLAARPLGYTCGTINGPGSVPPGLDEVVKGMRVGGRRKLTLPPQLAFGKAGRPPFIPPDATVQMDVSLWSVKPAGTDPNITLPGSSVF